MGLRLDVVASSSLFVDKRQSWVPVSLFVLTHHRVIHRRKGKKPTCDAVLGIFLLVPLAGVKDKDIYNIILLLRVKVDKLSSSES